MYWKLFFILYCRTWIRYLILTFRKPTWYWCYEITVTLVWTSVDWRDHNLVQHHRLVRALLLEWSPSRITARQRRPHQNAQNTCSTKGGFLKPSRLSQGRLKAPMICLNILRETLKTYRYNNHFARCSGKKSLI